MVTRNVFSEYNYCVNWSAQKDDIRLKILSKQNLDAQFELATLLKTRLRHRCFPVNLLILLGISFSQETSRRLLLDIIEIKWGNFWNEIGKKA